MKMIKRDWEHRQEINRETYVKKKKIKKENIRKIDIAKCRKETKTKRISKKLSRGRKVSI